MAKRTAAQPAATPAPRKPDPPGQPLHSQEILDALNGRMPHDNCNYQSRRRRRRELYAALLPSFLDASMPLDHPGTAEAARHALAFADLALVVEEQYEVEAGLPEVPRVVR